MVDSEVTMARAAVRVGLVLTIPVVGLAWLLRGQSGGLTALGAVVLVIGTFALTGHSMAWAARIGPVALQAVALGGFMLRLMLYAIGIVVLGPVDAVDGPVLAITVAVAMVVLLAYEVRLVLQHREFWWVTTADAPTATAGIAGKDRV